MWKLRKINAFLLQGKTSVERINIFFTEYFFNRNIDIKFPPNPEGSGGLVCLTP